MRRVAIAAVLWALGSGSAAAWAPIYSTRPVWRLPVPYALNSAGSVNLGGFAATEPEVNRAMDDWTRVSCTDLTNHYEGASSAVPGTYDGISVIGWLESSWPHTASAIGMTGPRWGTNITEADMELNGVNFTWTTGPGSASNVNTYSIVLHEGGHYYGLGHSTVPGSAMWPSYSGGVVGLGPDDEMGICALYGAGNCTTTGCPSGQNCVGGACQAASGGCVHDSDCASEQICSGGACVARPSTGSELGAPCTGDAMCRSGLCLAGVCSETCDWPSADSCPSGFYCQGNPASCNGGYCMAGGAGSAAFGETCGDDTDCASLYCDGGVCSQPCTPDGAVACPDGSTCQVGTLPCRGVCRRTRALGDRCDGNQDCASSMCAQQGERTFCTQLCDGASGCPDGFSCTPTGDQSVCVPDLGGLDTGCTTDPDCLSGICTSEHGGTYCTRRCASAADCPDGFSCGATDTDPSVCVRDARALGQQCDTNADCASGACAQVGATRICTHLCDESMPCPSDFECMSAGSAQVCQPMPPTPGGCGCRAAGGGAAPGPVAGCLALALLLWKRRRRG